MLFTHKKNWKFFLQRACVMLVPILAQTHCSSEIDDYALRIVAFGDSTTAERATIDQVYAQRLPDLLAGQGIAANVINSGKGGSHTGRLLDNNRHKIQHALDRFQRTVRDKNPDFVIIQFGINDSYVDTTDSQGASRIPLENYSANLTFMVETLKADSVQVVMMTPNSFGADKAFWRHKRLAAYAQVLREVAASQQVELIDIWQMFEDFDAVEGQSKDDLMLDGVHPNDAGHRLIAERLQQHIVGRVAAGAFRGKK